MKGLSRKLEAPRPAGPRKEKMDAAGLLLLLVFAAQMAALCYFNFTQLRNHMGYDASWNFLRAAMIWQEKTLVSPAWSETTNLHLDTHWPLASLLYGLTGNILLSFGIANTVMLVLILYVLYRILVRLDVGRNGRLIALNLVICPYLTTEFSLFNDLGYFSNVLTGASYYTLRVLAALLILLELLRLEQGQRSGGEPRLGILAWVIWPICLLCGFSSGVYLIVVLLFPCLVWVLERAVLRNDWKQLLRKESVFVYICTGCVAAGKALALLGAHFTALDSSRQWTSLTNLWKNFGAVIQGFMKLFQALPVGEDDKPLMTPAGLSRVFILAVFGIVVCGMAWAIVRTVKNRKKEDGLLLLLVNIVLVSFLVFGLYNVCYGENIFEERYLITVFFAGVILTGVFFGRLEKGRVLTVLLSLTMAGSLFAVDAHSDYNYLRTTNDAWQMDEIQALAEKQEAGVVYFWGDDLTVIGRVLRACDLNRVYKTLPDQGGWFIHWGDYTRYDNPEEYSGPTLLVCPKDKDLVPESVLENYTLLEELDQVAVYGSERNPRLF